MEGTERDQPADLESSANTPAGPLPPETTENLSSGIKTQNQARSSRMGSLRASQQVLLDGQRRGCHCAPEGHLHAPRVELCPLHKCAEALAPSPRRGSRLEMGSPQRSLAKPGCRRVAEPAGPRETAVWGQTHKGEPGDDGGRGRGDRSPRQGAPGGGRRAPLLPGR